MWRLHAAKHAGKKALVKLLLGEGLREYALDLCRHTAGSREIVASCMHVIKAIKPRRAFPIHGERPELFGRFMRTLTSEMFMG